MRERVWRFMALGLVALVFLLCASLPLLVANEPNMRAFLEVWFNG